MNSHPHYDYVRYGIIPLIPLPKGPRPTTSVMSTKRGGKRARQCDPNEPQKPISAYALLRNILVRFRRNWRQVKILLRFTDLLNPQF